MIYAIISDIHGNLEALETVIADAEKRKAERIICLGDIVGYGANPKECIEKVKSFHDVVCAGNHDHAATNQTDTSYFNLYARKAVTWTSAQLTRQDMSYIRSFPYVFEEEDFTAVHANLIKPEQWGYIFDDFDAVPNFVAMKKNLCFIGHSHVPLAFEKGEDIRPYYNLREMEIKEDHKYIFNVGSVGQPRDADPRASYCLLDTAAMTVEWRRLNYDIVSAQKKIIEAGLPYFLAERLQIGR